MGSQPSVHCVDSASDIPYGGSPSHYATSAPALAQTLLHHRRLPYAVQDCAKGSPGQAEGR